MNVLVKKTVEMIMPKVLKALGPLEMNILKVFEESNAEYQKKKTLNRHPYFLMPHEIVDLEMDSEITATEEECISDPKEEKSNEGLNMETTFVIVPVEQADGSKRLYGLWLRMDVDSLVASGHAQQIEVNGNQSIPVKEVLNDFLLNIEL